MAKFLELLASPGRWLKGRIAALRSDNVDVRDKAVMSSGAILTVLINALSVPFLSRMYSEEAYGVLTAFLAINALVLVPSMFRLEIAIQVPRSEEEYVDLCGLCLLILTGVTAIFQALTFFAGSWLVQRLAKPEDVHALLPVLFLAPGYLFFTASLALGRQMMMRERRHIGMTVALLSMTVIGTGLKFALFPFRESINPLVIAEVTGYVIGVAALVPQLRVFPRILERRGHGKRVLRLFRAYGDYPLGQLPASIIETVASSLPVLILEQRFGTRIMGDFGRAQSLLRIPIGALANPESAIFTNRGGLAYRETGECRAEYKLAFMRLLWQGVPIFVLLAITFPWIAPFVLGAKWVMAGHIGRAMSIYFLGAFCFGALSNVLFIARWNVENLLWITATLGVTAAALFLGLQTHDFLITVGAWSTAYFFMYLVVFVIGWKASSGQPTRWPIRFTDPNAEKTAA